MGTKSHVSDDTPRYLTVDGMQIDPDPENQPWPRRGVTMVIDEPCDLAEAIESLLDEDWYKAPEGRMKAGQPAGTDREFYELGPETLELLTWLRADGKVPLSDGALKMLAAMSLVGAPDNHTPFFLSVLPALFEEAIRQRGWDAFLDRVIEVAKGLVVSWYYGKLAIFTNPDMVVARTSTGVGAGILVLRNLLADCDDAIYARLVGTVRERFDELPPKRKSALAAVFPDEPDLAVRAFEAEQDDTDVQEQLTLILPPGELRTRAITEWPGGVFYRLCQTGVVPLQLLYSWGADAFPILLRNLDAPEVGDALARANHPDAVAALLEVATTGARGLELLRQAAARWSETTIAPLAEAAVGGGRLADLARPLLIETLPQVPEVPAGLSPAAAQLVAELREPAVTTWATDDELPSVLASPPWQTKRSPVRIPVVEVTPLDLPIEMEWDARVVKRAAKAVEYPSCRFTGMESAQAIQPNYRKLYSAISSGKVPGIVAEVLAFQKATKEYYANWKLPFNLDGADLVSGVGPELATQLWTELAGQIDNWSGVGALMHALGVAGLPGLRDVLAKNTAKHAQWAVPFGDVSLAPFMARAFAELKSARVDGWDWLRKWPEHAAAGLIPAAIGPKSDAQRPAQASLRALAADGRREVIERWAEKYGAEAEQAVAAVLDVDPLQNLPAKMPALPSWWDTATWRLPRLVSGAVLPAEKADLLGQMMALPAGDGRYAGLDQVVAATNRRSLADFGWDVFTAWLLAGGPVKDQWAMTALGYLGDDSTVAKIGPHLQAWPGESQSKRSVTGLEVLSGIGTDQALMMLNTLASRAKFKGLKQAADERLTRLADERALTRDQLDDLLAPDLGLDEAGTLVLDFGPRQFTVGFDEDLAPFVRDQDGTRLKALPRASQGDDAIKAKQASTAWQQLRKQATAVAGDQIKRLERAMVDQRRWNESDFGAVLVKHPLIRHLVTRIAWGVFDDGATSPTDVFRVAEDGSYASIDDEVFELGEGAQIGIPHPLALDADVLATLSALFTDYELAQPFPQLAREVERFTEAEAASTQLVRYANTAIPERRVFGLLHRGWRGGGDWVSSLTKELPDGRFLELWLTPGIDFSLASNSTQSQDGVTMVVGALKAGKVVEEPLGTVDAMRASEALRDLAMLTAR